MIKKAVITLGLVLLVLLALLGLLPVIFKNKISEKVKAEINSQIYGKVDYADFRFSVFGDFPNPTVSLVNVLVTSGEDFNHDTLAIIPNLSFSVHLASVLHANNYRILSLKAIQPVIRLKVNCKGQANWDMMKTVFRLNNNIPVRPSEKQASFSLQIKNWEIVKAFISTTNDTAHTLLNLDDLTALGTQTENKAGYVFHSSVAISELTYVVQGITYLSKTNFKASIQYTFDESSGVYTFTDNIFSLNAVQLQMDGMVKNTSEGQSVKLNIHSKDSIFKNLLSLVPAMYDSNFVKLRSGGWFSISGSISGNYSQREIPAIDFRLSIKNGSFQRVEFPMPLKNIFLQAMLSKPQGSLDSAVITISKLHLETGDDSANASVLITTPASNAGIEAYVNGNFNLEGLSQFYSIKDLWQLTGKVHGNLKFKGRINDLERKNYRFIETSGKANLTNVVYQRGEYDLPVNIGQASFTFWPGWVTMDRLVGNAGANQFVANGKLEQVIPYLTQHGQLIATLNLQSDKIFLPDLINKQQIRLSAHSKNTPTVPSSSIQTSNQTPVSAIRFVIHTSIQQLEYDKLKLVDVKGVLEINSDSVIARNLTARLFGGGITLNSLFTRLNKGPVLMNYDLTLAGMDIQLVYRGIDVVSKAAPSLQYMTGSFSGELHGKGNLKSDKTIEDKAFQADGKLIIPDLKIDDQPVLIDIAKMAKVKSLEHLEAKNVQSTFHFKNGETTLDPTDVKFVSGYKINFKGVHRPDQTMDADMVLDVPVKEFGSVANLAQNLLSGFMKVPENMQFRFKITGNSTNPDVKLSSVSTAE